MNHKHQKMLRPEVAAKYIVTEAPGRIALRALDYREIDLRTLTLAEADELLMQVKDFPYLKLRRKRRSKPTGA